MSAGTFGERDYVIHECPSPSVTHVAGLLVSHVPVAPTSGSCLTQLAEFPAAVEMETTSIASACTRYSRAQNDRRILVKFH